MWLAVDRNGEEWMYEERPIRVKSFWVCSDEGITIKTPVGTIQRLLSYPLTWEDEAEEIIEYKDNSTLNDDDIARISKASENQPIEYLRQKIVNLHDQLNKNRKTVQNQREELTRLLAQKEELQYKLNGVTNLVEVSIQNDDLWAKQLEEKDTIIKYLESKLYN